ncbi:MAG: hypothetical protein CMH20_00200 [Methylophaga sp.]|nr:hypothetical protein [Methylophaga sp.]
MSKEWSSNGNWRVFKNGSLVTTSGFEGYNSVFGDEDESGLGGSDYGQNQDSTLETDFIVYYDKPGSASSVYYELQYHPGSDQSFTLNRTYNGAGSGNSDDDGYERGISIGIIHELSDNASTDIIL